MINAHDALCHNYWIVLQKKQPPKKRDTLELTLALVVAQKGIQEIAKERGMTWTTIVGHVEKLTIAKKLSGDEVRYLFEPALLKLLPEIAAAFSACDTTNLSPVRAYLRNQYSFDTLRLARLALATQSQI